MGFSRQEYWHGLPFLSPVDHVFSELSTMTHLSWVALHCKEIQPVHPKGDQSWVFIGRTDVKLKLQYFGYLMQRADSFEKTLMLGKIEGRRRRG